MSPRTKTKEKPLNHQLINSIIFQLSHLAALRDDSTSSLDSNIHSGKSLGSNQTLSFSPKSAEFYTLSSRKPSQSHASHL
jgi:hypothetical protein